MLKKLFLEEPILRLRFNDVSFQFCFIQTMNATPIFK